MTEVQSTHWLLQTMSQQIASSHVPGPHSATGPQQKETGPPQPGSAIHEPDIMCEETMEVNNRPKKDINNSIEHKRRETKVSPKHGIRMTERKVTMNQEAHAWHNTGVHHKERLPNYLFESTWFIYLSSLRISKFFIHQRRQTSPDSSEGWPTQSVQKQGSQQQPCEILLP